MSEKCEYINLNNGNKIPKIGFGTWDIKPNEKCEEVCLEAIKIGYRLIDTAFFYQNEIGVGAAVRKCGLPREEIFITSKLWPNQFGKGVTEGAIDRMLKRFELPYIDLVLLHWPYGNYIEAWKDLEKCVKDNKIKSIGLSNFYEKELKEILDIATIKPVVNQLECHPLRNQLNYKNILEKEKIILESWSPIAVMDKDLFNNSVIINLSKKYNKTPTQIVLRWHVENNYIPLPRSANPVHIKENFDIFDFKLTNEEINDINQIKQKNTPIYDDERTPGWPKKVFEVAIKDE